MPGKTYFTLHRDYDPTGTNGQWSGPNGFICNTIELPDKDNRKQVSCIPGHGKTYPLKKILSPKHGWCLEVQNVPNRGNIEVHEANWAIRQLLGCIAPVTTLEPDKFGIGWRSGQACNLLESIIFPLLDAGEEVFLTIF